MKCKKMVLNSLILQDFRPVSDQKLEKGCSQKKMNNLRPSGLDDFR
jgi:hypothetical protein